MTENQATKHKYDANHPGICLITTLSSLGLEFKAVLLLWAEQFWDCQAKDEGKASLAQRQLYVAMTRAQDELHLLMARQVRFLQPQHFKSVILKA